MKWLHFLPFRLVQCLLLYVSFFRYFFSLTHVIVVHCRIRFINCINVCECVFGWIHSFSVIFQPFFNVASFPWIRCFPVTALQITLWLMRCTQTTNVKRKKKGTPRFIRCFTLPRTIKVAFNSKRIAPVFISNEKDFSHFLLMLFLFSLASDCRQRCSKSNDIGNAPNQSNHTNILQCNV